MLFWQLWGGLSFPHVLYVLMPAYPNPRMRYFKNLEENTYRARKSDFFFLLLFGILLLLVCIICASNNVDYRPCDRPYLFRLSPDIYAGIPVVTKEPRCSRQFFGPVCFYCSIPSMGFIGIFSLVVQQLPNGGLHRDHYWAYFLLSGRNISCNA